ncbi:MAG TPA: RidA family protein [Caulobacteraceae bacterium]|jgi:enamine deaminase RidA (YjgF/YER057c/UK114 family)|nr:RidA family protein [Caulobacteraceae bacterium]
MTKALLLSACLLLTTTAAQAGAPIVRTGAPAAPIAASVEVPAGSDIVYLSGMLPPVADPGAPPGTPAAYGDTTTQTVNLFKHMQAVLAEKGLTLGDVVMMRIYMVGDPAKAGHMDFAGMMAGYKQFFGTPDQPNKPARSTVQVAGLAATGPAMEIEVTAARPPK